MIHHKPFFVLIACLLIALNFDSFSQPVTLEAIKSYPFPTELTAAAKGSRIAWAFDESGKRNIYVAEGPEFSPRQLTNYVNDDAQELTSVSISADGQWVVYVRGGEHGSNWDDQLPVNPAFSTEPVKVQIWSIAFGGGEPKLIAEGDAPVISPKNDKIAFTSKGQVWSVPIDGSGKPVALFNSRGTNGSLAWSPDGSRLAFVSDRGDHSFVGVYTDSSTPIAWIAPSYFMDSSPRWSPDGTRLAFARTAGAGGSPDSILHRTPHPWSVWVGDVATQSASAVWNSPSTLAGSVPTTHGGTNLHWGAGERIVFLSYHDGWPHLYSVSSKGGQALLLTPGSFMAEYIKMSADGKWMVFCGNTGPDKFDMDRRHVIRAAVDKQAMEVLTPGDGLEWTPVVTGDGATVAFISATAQRPPVPAVMSFGKGTPKLIASKNIPAQFPTTKLVVPKQISFKSTDGFTVYGQMFEPTGGPSKKPAIVYVHGGPPRQMLLGWHYSDYYSNAYAINQYLASLGFVVITVNYRLGIGYGYEFHRPERAGSNGAAEYDDVKAAGVWLSSQPMVDASRIGIYGGSYGGFLTAMALARDSKLFAAGVDIHGVHDRTIEETRDLLYPDKYEKAPDAQQASKITWESSPISSMSTWTSPVLIIHADDDRNVRFAQSTDLVRRLEKQKVPMETLVIVDDTHHWMKHSNAVKVGQATADFLKKKLMK